MKERKSGGAAAGVSKNTREMKAVSMLKRRNRENNDESNEEK